MYFGVSAHIYRVPGGGFKESRTDSPGMLSLLPAVVSLPAPNRQNAKKINECLLFGALARILAAFSWLVDTVSNW